MRAHACVIAYLRFLSLPTSLFFCVRFRACSSRDSPNLLDASEDSRVVKEGWSLSSPESYRLIVKIFLKSKAKLFRLIPLKSVISGEPYEISFHIQNISEGIF